MTYTEEEVKNLVRLLRSENPKDWALFDCYILELKNMAYDWIIDKLTTLPYSIKDGVIITHLFKDMYVESNFVFTSFSSILLHGHFVKGANYSKSIRDYSELEKIIKQCKTKSLCFQ